MSKVVLNVVRKIQVEGNRIPREFTRRGNGMSLCLAISLGTLATLMQKPKNCSKIQIFKNLLNLLFTFCPKSQNFKFQFLNKINGFAPVCKVVEQNMH